ncbi:MAG TPA: methyltransferase domain-containing protein [Steroidobacteraceae bacterium]|nr:methyltransferase domain-containing protein [Steroidobacteraceae bacterium]
MYTTKRLIFNAATFVPGISALPLVKRKLAKRSLGTGGGAQSARYCYSVWLRHLLHARENKLNVEPRNIAELGPGLSLGIGLAAILTGVERYYAFDVVAHQHAERNLAVFDELITLFKGRAAIPRNNEFPNIGPDLPAYEFPQHLLDNERIERNLRPERLARVREALRRCDSPQSMIQYRAPWHTENAIERDSLDLVFSQAVLEHVDQLDDTYRAIYEWLRPTGYMSHQIDFKCHDSAREWNGHWTYSDVMWKIVRGKDTWLINREPHSSHLRAIHASGFRIVEDTRVERPSRIARSHLAPRFKALTDEDLRTGDAFIQALKPAS